MREQPIEPDTSNLRRSVLTFKQLLFPWWVPCDTVTRPRLRSRPEPDEDVHCNTGTNRVIYFSHSSDAESSDQRAVSIYNT
jgi:hypothetical protein